MGQKGTLPKTQKKSMKNRLPACLRNQLLVFLQLIRRRELLANNQKERELTRYRHGNGTELDSFTRATIMVKKNESAHTTQPTPSHSLKVFRIK